MGRHLLLILLTALAAAACGEARVPDVPGDAEAAGVDRHAGLTCTACHRGPRAQRDLASVPSASCTASGCHTDAGPAEVTLASATFEHRNHGAEDSVAMGCAGCHGHASGSEPLSTGTDACGLCHVEQLDGTTPGDCTACHRVPDHVGATSQTVEIRHETMTWLEGECVRCHYDVSVPTIQVPGAACADCHTSLQALTARSVGVDLHPDHTEVGCTACHGASGHRIVAMSSAVSLDCSQCHRVSHGVEVDAFFPGTYTCNACHGEVHAEQQRMLLGAVPGRPDAAPSEKFMDGLTCRSCHVSPSGRGSGGSTAVTGSEVSCTGCHQAEYGTVLAWWNAGTAQRVRLVEEYLGRASARVGSGGDSARTLMADAERLLTLVRAGGGQHNIPLTHDLLGASVARAGDAVRAGGGTPPTPPALGRRPRMGICTYCHYRTDDQMRFGEMNEDFHRRALGVDRLERGGD